MPQRNSTRTELLPGARGPRVQGADSARPGPKAPSQRLGAGAERPCAAWVRVRVRVLRPGPADTCVQGGGGAGAGGEGQHVDSPTSQAFLLSRSLWNPRSPPHPPPPPPPRTLSNQDPVWAPREAGPPKRGRGGRKGRGRGPRPRAEEQRGLGRRLPPAGLPGAPARGGSLGGPSPRPPRSPAGCRLGTGGRGEGPRAPQSRRGGGGDEGACSFALPPRPSLRREPHPRGLHGGVPPAPARLAAGPRGEPGAGGDRNWEPRPQALAQPEKLAAAAPARPAPSDFLPSGLRARGARGAGRGRRWGLHALFARVRVGTRLQPASASSLHLARRGIPEAGAEPEAYFGEKAVSHCACASLKKNFFYVISLYQVPSQNLLLINYSEEQLTVCSDA